jgi:hypothetical protein
MNPTWEYAVMPLATRDPPLDAVRVQAKFFIELNDAGKDGWECFQIVPGTNGYVIFYKRPVR